MPERIFKAVAMPPNVMFAPMVPAAANMGLWSLLMMFSQVVFAGTASPLLFIIGAIVSHIGLILWGFKEPHLSTVMQARGQSMRSTKNLKPTKDFKSKYVP